MSENPPIIEPRFLRKAPEETANIVINKLFKDSISASIADADAKGFIPRDEYVDMVIEGFMTRLGEGAVMAKIEEIAKEFPSQYVAVVPRSQTALKYVTRTDFRSYAHPGVLSPILAIEIEDGKICYIGTDKLGHMAQQGYDYWKIYKWIEAKQPGFGELYARAWGVWTEGEELSTDDVRKYLESKNLPSDDEQVGKLQKELRTFLTDSEEIKFMSPTPEFAKGNTVLRRLAHAIGTHEKGILGTVSSGIFSYADLEANVAGLKFYLDLEKRPEFLAENFDIKNYVACNWDEEILKSKPTPLVEKRIEEAVAGRKKPEFSLGLGVNYDILNKLLGVTTPLFLYGGDNIELRLRLGGALHLSSDAADFQDESQLFTAGDFLVRLKNLHFAHLTAQAGMTTEGEFRPMFALGYELQLLGRTSFYVDGLFDPSLALSPSIAIGFLWLIR